MSYRRLLHSVVGITLVVVFAVGCGGAPPTAAPVSEAPVPTATPVPPPATPTPAPPTSTPTAMPAQPESATATLQPAQEQLKVDIQLFQLNSQALAGNLLGDDTKRPVQVILPPGYAASDKRYPVVYYLHGGLDPLDLPLDAMQDMWLHWHEEIENASGDFIAYVEQSMQRGEMQDMILVFPNATNKLTGSWYLSSPTLGDYETYLTQEVVNYVDSHYRTLPQRDSRAIAGCSVGGDGAAHLGLKYPDVYAVVVSQSGFYFWDRSPGLLEGVKEFTGAPADYSEFLGLSSFWVQGEIALAAGVAPNPNKPPFYLDMPFVMVNGTAEIAPGFVDKAVALDPRSDVERYLAQPTRLNALLVQHGANDDLLPVELARDFDKLLTEKGIAHEFDDSFITHCSYDMVPPMLKFMSDHLVGEGAGE